MEKTIVSEGKTTNEAIENGLKQLNVSRNSVDVKVLESGEKRSFFSILAPRVVKVQLTLKDDIMKENTRNIAKDNTNKEVVSSNSDKKLDKTSSENGSAPKYFSAPRYKKSIRLSEQEQKKAVENIEKFLKPFIKNLPEGTTYKIRTTGEFAYVNIDQSELGYLIGYKGETLNALQNIMSVIAGKGIPKKVRIVLDIDGYKTKREKTLEELAKKIANTVIKTGKSIKLEPMQPYERKVIHSTLHNNSKVETMSVGEDPYRRVVVSLRKPFDVSVFK